MNPFAVVAAIDFSTASETVVSQALALAALHPQNEVHLVNVQEMTLEVLPPTHEELRSPLVPLRELAERASKLFLNAHPDAKIGRIVAHVLVGPPASEIVALAAALDADAVVVGTHGRRGIKRALLGSVAEKVVRLAGCLVSVVRPKAHDEALKIPEIEPPCADCLAARNASQGKELWCERHAQHHVHAHLYSYDGPSPSPARPWGFAS